MRSPGMRPLVFSSSLMLLPHERLALAQAPYFQNKTIKIIRGGEPGRHGDLQARALIPYLEKAYSRGSDHHRRKHARRRRTKGRELYFFHRQAGRPLDRRGRRRPGRRTDPWLSGSQYDLDKLIYLGSTESGDPYAFVSRKESGLDSWKNSAPRPDCASARKPSGIRST